MDRRAKVLAETMPVQTPGLGSDGVRRLALRILVRAVTSVAALRWGSCSNKPLKGAAIFRAIWRFKRRRGDVRQYQAVQSL